MFLSERECDSYTNNYYDYRTERTVILGFSKQTRNLFAEMRKCAANFERTSHLAEYNADFKHSENYSMGDGLYLGRNKYSGWTINKEPIYGLENFLERFAHTAGDEANIHLKAPQPPKEQRAGLSAPSPTPPP